ncbi:tyrosine-type recombinase/integrase [Niallia sp. Sow4_A1]|uniref:site-specific integrase n=1 Tax=unclassified Niallia TaxID=2837522 RepID=UPI0037C7CB57
MWERKQKKARGFKTKKEATEELRKIEVEIIQGTYIEPSKVLFKNYMEDWFSLKKMSISNQTIKLYEYGLANHILPSLGSIPLSNLRPIHIQKMIAEMHKKELAGSTIRRIFNIVNTCLNYAVKVGDVPKNVAQQIDRPKVSKKELNIWDIDQIKKFLNAAKEDRLYCAFYLAIMTGLRQGEILGLQWKYIDFHNRTLFVRQILEHDGKRLKKGAKTDSSIRTIALSPSTIKVLKDHYQKMQREKEQFIGDSNAVFNHHDLVICSNVGTPLNPRNLVRTFNRLIQEADLPKIRFHDLRHSHASLMIYQNEPIKLIAERMGHSKITTTMDTYGHLLPNMQRNASDKLDDTLFGPSKEG